MKRILLLGGTGYIGTILSRHLENNFKTIKIGTKTTEAFIIGENFSENMFDDIDIVFYLSWFFDTTDKDYESKNIKQLKDVVQICKRKNINMYFFSTYYADERSSSKYNRTKYSCEQIVVENNFSIVKLGAVVLKEGYGGFYGYIIDFIKKFKILPVFTPRKRVFYKTDSSHILSLVNNLEFSKPKTYFVCEEKPIFFEDLFEDLNTHFVKFYIPWRIPYALLFLLEKFGLKLNFRSDSILSIWGNQ